MSCIFLNTYVNVASNVRMTVIMNLKYYGRKPARVVLR
jgi:hypothetical protein